MAIVQAADPRSADPRHAQPRETFLHVVARDFKWALRVACLVLLVATVVFMTTIFMLAIPTVILLLLCYALLVVAESVEHRTEHLVPGAEPAHAESPPHGSPATPEVQRAEQRTTTIERRVTRISIEVLGGALVLAAGMGAAVFHWTVLPIAGLVLLGYIILVTAPVWLAWMEDDVEEAVKGQRRPMA